jgi:hypothetical protein
MDVEGHTCTGMLPTHAGLLQLVFAFGSISLSGYQRLHRLNAYVSDIIPSEICMLSRQRLYILSAYVRDTIPAEM